MTNPFAAPASATGIDLNEYIGTLLIIEPLTVEIAVPTVNGPADAVRANISVVDGPKAGERYNDVLLFPKVLASQLRPSLGLKVLGRVNQGVAQPGKNKPWLLVEADAADVAAGVAFLNRTSFTTPAAAAAGGNPPF